MTFDPFFPEDVTQNVCNVVHFYSNFELERSKIRHYDTVTRNFQKSALHFEGFTSLSNADNARLE